MSRQLTFFLLDYNQITQTGVAVHYAASLSFMGGLFHSKVFLPQRTVEKDQKTGGW